MQKCTLALGCFWKPEENFKNKPGILDTEVGYAGGNSEQTTYEEVCTGSTGHAEVVRLAFDENIISFKNSGMSVLESFSNSLIKIKYFK